MRQVDVRNIPIRVRRRVVETDIIIDGLPFRAEITAKHKIRLISNSPATVLCKNIHTSPATLKLNTKCDRWVTRTIFDKGENELNLLDNIGTVVSTKNTHTDNSIKLSSNAERLTLTMSVSAQNYFNLTSSEIDADNDETLRINNDIRITTMVNTSAHKNIELSHISELTAKTIDISDTVMAVFVSPDTGYLNMISSANAEAVKMRIIGEMDVNDLTLAEFDSMKIDEVDFIVLDDNPQNTGGN